MLAIAGEWQTEFAMQSTSAIGRRPMEPSVNFPKDVVCAVTMLEDVYIQGRTM